MYQCHRPIKAWCVIRRRSNSRRQPGAAYGGVGGGSGVGGGGTRMEGRLVGNRWRRASSSGSSSVPAQTNHPPTNQYISSTPSHILPVYIRGKNWWMSGSATPFTTHATLHIKCQVPLTPGTPARGPSVTRTHGRRLASLHSTNTHYKKHYQLVYGPVSLSVWTVRVKQNGRTRDSTTADDTRPQYRVWGLSY